MPSFNKDILNENLNNENTNLTSLVKPERIIHCVFIIENLMGITGGNITLKKLVLNLSRRNLKISILTRTANPRPINGVRIFTVPNTESFSKSCPDCDIVVAHILLTFMNY